jgi:xanthine phosphoribosyltransferase
MQHLKTKIREDGIVLSGNILKVDSFLNHQLDIELLNHIGQAFKDLFKDKEVTKILTIEASGIAIAYMAGLYFNVPVLFAKKSENLILSDDFYQIRIYSYTKQKSTTIYVSKKYLNKDDKILILDDFLAHGEAIRGLRELVEASGATLQGVGIVIEKAFQEGGDKLRKEGVDIRSLVSITSMNQDKIEFKDE